MVDIQRRKLLATHLRHLCVGQISNDEYETRVMRDVSKGKLPEQYQRCEEAKTDDPIIPDMLLRSWYLYDDRKQHKLVGRQALSKEDSKEVARYLLFLNTDQEYKWSVPKHPLLAFSVREFLLSLITLGGYLIKRTIENRRKARESNVARDANYWPFATREEFEQALENPKYLAKNV